MAEPVVSTRSGRLQGYEKDGLFIFKGVPFAAPPVGERRWLPPQPVQSWLGVREATRFAAISPQNQSPVTVWRREEQPQSEDCLYLNVWTPGLDDKKRPVMVWIHGGGFTSGSGSGIGYNGRKLAQRGNTVIVTINYRLGALGFLALNDVTGGKISAGGNEGLLDQVAALQWVHDNIAAFGGDPANVTIFGESAGGMSCGCLLAMSAARGLFHKAILQSGAASTVQSAEAGARIARLFLEVVGVKENDTAAIRALKVEQLLPAQARLPIRIAEVDSRLGTMPHTPIIDGKALPENPLKAVQKGAANDIPVLVGSTLEEWGLFAAMDPAIANLSEAHMVARLRRFVPTAHIPALVEAYRSARAKRGESTATPDIFGAIQTDHVFRIPAVRLAEAKQMQRKHAYHYIFTWKSPALQGRLGACHAIDVGFVFGSHEENFCGAGPDADALSMRTQDAWLAFARNGDPSCESVGKWPPYGAKRETMLLGQKCELVNTPFEAERLAWDAIPGADVGGL